MLEDLIKGIREYVSDRFMSPLGAAIATSWLGWNFKFILVVFSSEPVIRKLHLIKLIYQDSVQSFFVLTIGPITTAAIYIFLFPYPSRLVYEFTLKQRRKALDTLRKIHNETPITAEERDKLRDQITQIETEHVAERLRLNNSLDAAKEQLRIALEGKHAAELALLETQERDREPANDDAPDADAASSAQVMQRKPMPVITGTHVKALRALSSTGVAMALPELAEAIEKPPSVAAVVGDDLVNLGYAEEAKLQRGDGRIMEFAIQLTASGIRYLLTKG